jgi:hypothetical protein
MGKASQGAAHAFKEYRRKEKRLAKQLRKQQRRKAKGAT